MKKAAIVILNFNGKGMLKKYLPQVYNHSVYEIIIVDNGSCDGSVDYLLSHYPEIKLVLLKENHGYSKGYNLGLEKLKGDYEFYILLNSDVTVEPQWDEKLIQYLAVRPQVAVCQPKILSLGRKGSFDYAGAAGGYLDSMGYPFCRGRLLHTLEMDRGQYDESTPVDWASGACFCVKAALFHDFGGFNPHFFSHMEEIDLCWRMRKEGFQIHCCSETKVYHLGGGTLSEVNPFKTYLNFRNSLYMLYNNLTVSGFLQVIWLRFLLDCAAMIHLLFTKGWPHGKAVAMAYLDFGKKRKEIGGFRISRTKSLKSEKSRQIFSIIFQYYLFGKRKFTQLT
ncbi:glycosyltransferase family 2 protein [Cyclobacterium plantarum]|uniref:Glycosyltransferase family 2 protein n=1 Tax=Cyclobacterium plantarum TaxID=2716263 RepID=A0ABX0H368_9BACT|nr:glycosyltransferase family 2 protein [Cyclobacterium plantarum]NHE55885.1 glycosyltransferase family 2 protein [Cyclobacterium plantarum]